MRPIRSGARDDGPFLPPAGELRDHTRVAGTLVCYVIAPARKARTGRIGLRATGDGFGTPRFDDDTRITVSGDRLVIDPGDHRRITTLRAAAEFVDLPLSSDPGVGTDLPPFAPDDDLMVDADASRALGAWYAFADRVLRDLAVTEPAMSDAQLWPEHFDLAAQLDLDRRTKVNVGFSPGDQFSADPYVYVGPPDTDHLADEFWNAPFGAILGYDALTSTPTPEHEARRFIKRGLDLLRTPTRLNYKSSNGRDGRDVSIDVWRVGHVVLKVTDLDRALGFYCATLGLTEVARGDFGDGIMVFLSTGRQHHDIGLVEVAGDARRPEGSDIGLYHVALKIGDDLDTLRAAKARLEECGVQIQWIGDHRVSQSLYVADPDGNNIELYVDADPAIWRTDPAAVATAVDLDL